MEISPDSKQDQHQHEIHSRAWETVRTVPPDLSRFATLSEAARHAWEWAYGFYGVELGHETIQDHIDLPYFIVMHLIDDLMDRKGIGGKDTHSQISGSSQIFADAIHDGLAMWADQIVEGDPQQLPYLQGWYDACRKGEDEEDEEDEGGE